MLTQVLRKHVLRLLVAVSHDFEHDPGIAAQLLLKQRYTKHVFLCTFLGPDSKLVNLICSLDAFGSKTPMLPPERRQHALVYRLLCRNSLPTCRNDSGQESPWN